jgi:HD-GYP domain-containing protein (c-di-GMP phosphodiesterase class II)
MTNSESDFPTATISQQSQALLKVLSSTFGINMCLLRKGTSGWQSVYQFGIIGNEKPSDFSGTNEPLDGELSDSQWHLKLPTSLCTFLDALVESAPSDSEEPRVISVEKHSCFVAARSAGEQGEVEVVGGIVPMDGLRLTERLLRLSVQSIEIDEMRELNSQYATRLSSSFEELCFLQRLSQTIEYCVGNRSLAEVAPMVLSEMRQIVGVEAMCLIEAFPAGNTWPSHAGKFLAIEGELPVGQEFWLDAIDGLSHQTTHAIVRNLQNSLYKNGFRDTQEVRSFALVPIRKEEQLYGWLLAINKKVPRDSVGVLLNSLGDDELGSMEASMLEVAARIIGAQAANHQLFKALEQLVVDVIRILVNVVEAKDPYTSGHSNRVAQIARRLAEQLELSEEECETIYTSGLLHDIGKIGIPDEVLKKPGKLTDAEFEEIKQHPQIGVRLLEKIAPLEKYLPGVLSHHESVDGTGYPHGLRGDQIPLMARILSVADALDAMTSHRPYRQGMPVEKAAAILQSGAGQQWDSNVVSAYFAATDSINPHCNSWCAQTDSPQSPESSIQYCQSNSSTEPSELPPFGFSTILSPPVVASPPPTAQT